MLSDDAATALFHLLFIAAGWMMWRHSLRLYRQGVDTIRPVVAAFAAMVLAAVVPLTFAVTGHVPVGMRAQSPLSIIAMMLWWWWMQRDQLGWLRRKPKPDIPPGMIMVMRGLPGSGKSTKAMQWVNEDFEHRARVGRDYIRRMLHGRYRGPVTEKQVSSAMVATIAVLVRSGIDVVVDDTNLEQRHLKVFKDIAVEFGATVKIVDLRGVPLSVCKARNACREGDERLKDEVIEKMWRDHIEPIARRIAALN